MEYRRAEEQDMPVLVTLMGYLGYSHTTESLLTNFRALQSKGGAVFVACVNHDIVACITAIIDVRFAGGVSGEIVSLVVLPSARRMGVGKGLVAHAESWLSDQTAVIRVRANVIRDNAHLFYKDLGYKEEKSQKIFEKVL